MFKEKFVRLLQQRGISALKLAQETGIPKSVVYEWRSGLSLIHIYLGSHCPAQQVPNPAEPA